MQAVSNIAPVVASLQTTELLREENQPKRYLEHVNYKLKTFARHVAIVEKNVAVLGYTRTASMTPIQYADHLYFISFSVAGVQA